MAPLAAAPLPPLLDYPNHLARMYILSSLPANAALGRYFTASWAPIPDLAADAIVPFMADALPIELAMRLFLGLILLATAGGVLALHRAASGSWSAWPLSAFLLLYNRMLLWGFINYLAGVALALWALALWIAFERDRPLLRLALGFVAATVVYLAHLAAFGCYALAVIAWSAAPPAAENFRPLAALNRVAPAVLTLLPAAALFLASPTAGAPAGIAYGNPLRKLDLPVSIFDNYNRAFDGVTFATVAAAVLIGLARGWITLDRRLAWSLGAVLAAYVLLPSQFLSASGIDHRLPIAFALLFVGASRWEPLGEGPRRLIAGLILLLLLVRIGLVTSAWAGANELYRSLRPAFAMIPEGSAVAVASPAADVRAGGAPLLHFPALATVLRDAFVPILFADPSQQPLVLTPEGRALADMAPAAPLWDMIRRGQTPTLRGYDRLIIVDPPRPLAPERLPGAVLFDAPRLVLIDLTARPPEYAR